MPFPPIPTDTARAAETAFGKGNLYLLIGDQVDPFLADIDLDCFYDLHDQTVVSPPLLALVTIFQFVEDLSDYQAAEAIRLRTDWKYALHLPLVYPGLNPPVLCDFRRRLIRCETGKAKLQQLVMRLNASGRLNDCQSAPDAGYLLTSVCTLSRVELAARTMHAAVQALAAQEPEWLIGIALPHWYERYGRSFSTFRLPRSPEARGELLESIAADGRFLLQAAAGGGRTDLTQLPDVRQLMSAWQQLFGQAADGPGPNCAHCAETMLN